MVGNSWGTVKDQESWTGIVKENTTSNGKIDPLWSYDSMTGVREIWGPDNQFYGYLIHQTRDLVNATVIDETRCGYGTIMLISEGHKLKQIWYFRFYRTKEEEII